MTPVEHWQMGVECERDNWGTGVRRLKHPDDDRVTIYSDHVKMCNGVDAVECVVSMEIAGGLSAQQSLELCRELGHEPVSLRARYCVSGGNWQTGFRSAEKEAKEAALAVVGHELPWWDDRGRP